MNNQLVATITDSDRFGSTFSAKKVQLDTVEAGGFDMMGGGMMGDFEDDLDEEGGNKLPKEMIETQLLLGDRKTQEIGEMFTNNLFKSLEGI